MTTQLLSTEATAAEIWNLAAQIRGTDGAVPRQSPGLQVIPGLRKLWDHTHYGFPGPGGRAGSEHSDVPSLPQTYFLRDVLSGIRQGRGGIKGSASYIIRGAQCKMYIYGVLVQKAGKSVITVLK